MVNVVDLLAVLSNFGQESSCGGGPPECIAASFEACGEDDNCIGATLAVLCAGEIDRSSCSEEDNADIDSHCSEDGGGGGEN